MQGRDEKGKAWMMSGEGADVQPRESVKMRSCGRVEVEVDRGHNEPVGPALARLALLTFPTRLAHLDNCYSCACA